METKIKRRSLRTLKKSDGNGADAEKNVQVPSSSSPAPGASLKSVSKTVCTKVVFSPDCDIFTAISAQKSGVEESKESDSVLVVVEIEDSQEDRSEAGAGGGFESSDCPEAATDKMGKSNVSAINDPSTESSTANESTDALQIPEPSEECEILSDSLPVDLPTTPELNSTIITEAKNAGDILLIAGSEPNVVKVLTHKSLLMKASSYFNELFARSPDTSSIGSDMVAEKKIEISDPQILSLLVKKLEEDSLVSFPVAMKLIKDSTKLQMDLLSSKCMTAIVGNVTAKNVLRLKLLAVESDNKDLCRVADSYFEKYINTVISSKEFLSLSLKQIAGLISPSNRAISARCVDKMAQAWLAHENRRTNDSYFCQITSLQILRKDSKLEESIFWNENGAGPGPGGSMSSLLPLFEPPDIPAWVYMQAIVTPKRASNALPHPSQIYVAPSMQSPSPSCQPTLKSEVDENDPIPMELHFADGIFDIMNTADFKSPPRHKISSLPKIPKITDRLKSISNSEIRDPSSDPWAVKENSRSWNPMNSQSNRGCPKPSAYGSSDLSSWARGGSGSRSGSNFGGSRGRGGERLGRGNGGSRGGYGGRGDRDGGPGWGGSQGASGDDEDWGAPSTTTAPAPSAAPQCRNSSNNSNAGDEDDWGDAAPTVKKPSVSTTEDSWGGQSSSGSNFNSRDSWDNQNSGSGSRGFGNGNSGGGRGRGGRGYNNNSSRTSSGVDDWGNSSNKPADDLDDWGDTKASSSSAWEATDNKRKSDSVDDWGSASSSNFNQGDSQSQSQTKYTRGSDGSRGFGGANSNRGSGNSGFQGGGGRGGGGRGGFGNNSSWANNSNKNDDDDWGSSSSSKINKSAEDDEWGTPAPATPASSGDNKKKADDWDDWGSPTPISASANAKPKDDCDDGWGSSSNGSNSVSGSGRGGGGRGGFGNNNNRNESNGRNNDYQGGRGRGGGYRGGGDNFRSRGGGRGRGGGDRGGGFGGGGRGGGRGGYNAESSSRGGYNNNKSNWGGRNETAAVGNVAPEDEDWDSEPKAKTDAGASTNVNVHSHVEANVPKIEDDDEWGDPVVTQTPVAVAVAVSLPQEPQAPVKPAGTDCDDEWGDGGVTAKHIGSAHVPAPAPADADAVKCLPLLPVSLPVPVPVTAAQMETPQADAKTTVLEPSPMAVSDSDSQSKNDEDKFVAGTQEDTGNGNGTGTCTGTGASTVAGTLIQKLVPPAALPPTPTVEVKPSAPLPSNDEDDEWG